MSLYLLIELIVFMLVIFVLIQHFNQRIDYLKSKLVAIEEQIHKNAKSIQSNRLLIEQNKENLEQTTKKLEEE